jgi:putative transposase
LSYYYRPTGETEEILRLMRLLDEQYTHTPCYGIRRMTEWPRARGHKANHNRVARLLRQVGLAAIYPKLRLSLGRPEHKMIPIASETCRSGDHTMFGAPI